MRETEAEVYAKEDNDEERELRIIRKRPEDDVSGMPTPANTHRRPMETQTITRANSNQSTTSTRKDRKEAIRSISAAVDAQAEADDSSEDQILRAYCDSPTFSEFSS
ncbi:hypothetical protein KM043_012218 [Ampulex compressa]|nr:hypothetical protein KM043_012218 [Ampulex compressa]